MPKFQPKTPIPFNNAPHERSHPFFVSARMPITAIFVKDLPHEPHLPNYLNYLKNLKYLKNLLYQAHLSYLRA